MTDPLNLFAPELVQAIERLVDERVKAALAELEPSNGSPGCRSLTPPSTWASARELSAACWSAAASVPPTSVVAGSCTATTSTSTSEEAMPRR